MKKINSIDLLKDFASHVQMTKKDCEDYEQLLKDENYIYIDFDKKSRLDIINLAIKKTNAKSYLEIGCDRNEIFSNICVTNKVGVDPRRGGTLRMTSDNFFKINKEKFDVIFIDGLHCYEQLRRDVLNSLKFLKDNGIIIIHDMLPVTEKQTFFKEPVPWYPGWLGDIYKTNFELTKVSDFDFYVVKTDLGCGIITNYNGKDISIPRLDINWNFYKNQCKNLPLVSYKEIKKILS